MNKLLEDFYKRPIAMQAARLQTLPHGSSLIDGNLMDIGSSSLLQDSTKLPSVSLRNPSSTKEVSVSLKSGTRQTERATTLEIDDRMKASRNADVRLSTLTQPMPKHLRVSVIAAASIKSDETKIRGR